jgi:hypothetical protein
LISLPRAIPTLSGASRLSDVLSAEKLYKNGLKIDAMQPDLAVVLVSSLALPSLESVPIRGQTC